MQQNQKTKYLISIIPLTRIPLTRDQFFYYLSENPIPTGSLCEIPFGKWKTKGIVLNSKNDFARAGGIELKKVSQILIEKFLTPQQLKLTIFISNYYLSPLGIVLKHFLPTPTKSRKKPTEKTELEKYNQTIPNEISHTFTNYNQHQNPKVGTTAPTTPFFDFERKYQNLYIQTQLGIQKMPEIATLIKNIQTLQHNNVQTLHCNVSTTKQQKIQSNQILYLVPEIAQIFEIQKSLTYFFGEEKVVLLHSKLTKGQFYENWEKIRNQKAQIIIGTRMALFAPFQNLVAIFTDNYTDISYKQWDMNPRYNTQKVTQKLAQIFNCPNYNLSSFLSVSDYFLRKNNIEQEVMTPCSSKQMNFSSKLTITDLKKDRWQKRFSPISQELEFKLKKVLEKKEQALLFINRQGLSAFSICAKCKIPLKCPQCERALIGKKDGTFTCLHCKFTTDIFPKCPQCFSLEFKNLGLGTEKIEKELKKIFPQAKIEKVDQSVKFTNLEKIHQDFKSGKIDILIGTQMITENWNSSNLTLTAVLDFDNLTSLPEFNASEKTLTFIMSLQDKIIDKKNGELIIQTFDEFNPILKSVQENNFTKIYEEEIENRQALSYPPFWRLVKLIYRSNEKETAEKQCKIFYEKIVEKTKNEENLKIIIPHLPLVSKIRTQYRYQIVIKYRENLPEDLADELKRLDKNWIVDIDPISLI